jgi:hypothetical protein
LSPERKGDSAEVLWKRLRRIMCLFPVPEDKIKRKSDRQAPFTPFLQGEKKTTWRGKGKSLGAGGSRYTELSSRPIRLRERPLTWA